MNNQPHTYDMERIASELQARKRHHELQAAIRLSTQSQAAAKRANCEYDRRQAERAQ